MDWTARPLHATNLQARNFQVQGLYQSQQSAPGFSQASASTQNSSAYIRNGQAIKTHSGMENMVPNQLSSSNNVGFSNLQPPHLKPSGPIGNFVTTQHFVGHHPLLQISGMTVQKTSGMSKNTCPNSNMLIFSSVAPQPNTVNSVQRPPNGYMASDMYNNHPQKNSLDSVQGSVFQNNINSSYSKRLPKLKPKYRPTNPQAQATVPLNQVSSHLLNSQNNSSCLTFSSGQNIQNQINNINSGSTTAVQSLQYASGCVYSSPYTVPTHYAAQVIPQAINTNLPPPPYSVPPIQVNHGQSLLPQLVPNTSNENVQNPQNLNLDQSSASYTVQHVQTPQSVAVSRATSEVGRSADSAENGHSAENQPSNELTKSVVDALKSIFNRLQIPGTVPLDKTSAPHATGIMEQDNTAKNSGNVLDSLINSNPITTESLELDKQEILRLQAAYKLKRQIYLSVAQQSKTSDPSVHNPDQIQVTHGPHLVPNTSNENVQNPQNLDSVIKSEHITKESLELDMREILTLQAAFKFKRQLYLYLTQKSKTSDPSVHNPNHLLPTSNTSQQPAPLPQATHQTFSLLSHDTTQNLTSSLPHDSSQNQPPSLIACSSKQIQDSSLQPLRTKNDLYPILQELLKGTCDEKMLLNPHFASTERNQNKQLFVHEKRSSGSVLDSSSAKFETTMNNLERVSGLNPKTSQTVSTQGSLTSTNVSLGFEQTSALDKDQLTNMSAMSGGDLFNHFLPNEDKMETTVTKILTNLQNTVSVQNAAALSESAQLSEQLTKEGSKNFLNPRSEFIQQSKDPCLQASDESITAWNKGSDISSSVSLAATVSEAERVQNQRYSFTGNSRTIGRTCSLEELETSLALWKKSPATSLNDQFCERTKSAVHSPSLDGVEDKEMAYTMKNFSNALIHYEKSSITAGKNEPTLFSVSSSLGQKLDAVSSSSSKSSEPQVAIVPPLILSKEGIRNEVQEENLSSVLEKMYPVIAEGSIDSLHEFILPLSDTDKPVKRTACSQSNSCVAVKEVDSDMHQKTTKSTEENGIRRAESGTDCSCDPNQGLTGPLELEKNTPQFCSRDSAPPGSNNGISSPISQNCALKPSPDLVEAEDTVLNENMLQISNVCTLVQGDACYNSQIASIFNTSSKAQNYTSSEDQRPDSYNKEQSSQWKREYEMNVSASVGDGSSPSVRTLSKAIAEKLLRLSGLKKHEDGMDSDEVNVRDSEEEKIKELINSSSGEVPEENISCSDVHSRDLACGYQEVRGNSIVDEGSAFGIQEHVPSDENQIHSVNNIDTALTLPDDQLTELLKEFPYGIDDSNTLKKTENEDFVIKVNEIKDGRETQTCGQNSEANHSLAQIKITILNPQQRKKLFPECSSHSSNKLENRENDKLMIVSDDTNKSHIQTVLVESINTSAESVQKRASHSFCCLSGWLASKYAVEPCAHMLAKEATLKQQLDQYLPSEIMIKDGSETNKTSTDCQLNNQQQATSNSFLSEVESNRILSKTYVQRESDLQEKGRKLLKEDKGLNSFPFLEKLEPLKAKHKQQRIEKLAEKVQIDELCNQKCIPLISKSQVLHSGTHDSKGESVRPACKRELSDKESTPKETVVYKSKSDTIRHKSMESRHSKRKEKYKIKRDSSETHIIKGPTYHFKGGLKKHATSEGKQKTKERPCTTFTNSSNLVSKTYNNAQYSKEHLNKQKCETERGLENNKAMRTERSESCSSESVQQNKGSFARKNLKKFAYPGERGNIWKDRRSLSDNFKTSKEQMYRGQHLNIHKTNSSRKEVVWGAHKINKCFERTLSDKRSSCNRKSNILTLQREQKKNYLNKVAFKQTEQSICLTKLEQSPSKSVWHVKSSNASEHLEDKKNYTLSSQQSEVVKPQMLEFKMCPETVFKNLVSEEVSDAKKLPEKERIPVSAVKSRREDWLNYTPLKRRKSDEKETQVDDRIPLDTAMELLDKNDAIKNSNATFETYRKMHLEKRSRSLDS